MDDPQETGRLEPPPGEPDGPFKHMLRSGAIGIVTGAAVGAGFAKLAGQKAAQFWDETISLALTSGFISGLIGYFRGKEEVQTHHFKAENVKLKNKMAKMEEKIDGMTADREFTKALIQEKIDEVKTSGRKI